MTTQQAATVLAAGILGALAMGAQVQCSQADAHPPSISTPSKTFQMVGASTEEVTGDVGVFGMTLACQADFPVSRMCTSEEVMNTVTVPLGQSDSAWVRPSFQPTGASPAMNDPQWAALRKICG